MENEPVNNTSSNKKSEIQKIYLLLIVAVFIALAASIIGLFNIYSISQEKSLLGSTQRQRSFTDEQLAKNIETLQKKLNNSEKQIALLMQTMQQPAGNRWHLTQAYYLTQLAYYHLQTEQDPALAKKILQAAYLSFASLTDPQYASIKQLFSNKIIELQATPSIPYQALLEKTNAIDALVDKMPNSNPKKNPVQLLEATKKHKKQNFKEKAWRELKSLIIIRRHDQPITPLLPEQEQVYLLQNIHFLLHQAQWAVLNRQQTVFNDVIEKMMGMISQHYVVNNSIVNAVLLNLGQLEKINLQPKMPDLTPLLNQLNTLIVQTNMQAMQKNTYKDVS